MNHTPNDNAQTVDDLKGQFVCYQCVGEKYLSAEIIRAGSKQSCSYCDGLAEAYSIGEMAERIAAVFEEHYVRTSDQPEARNTASCQIPSWITIGSAKANR